MADIIIYMVQLLNKK